MIFIKCDRCGYTEESSALRQIDSVDDYPDGWDTVLRDEDGDIDLCPECSKLFYAGRAELDRKSREWTKSFLKSSERKE
jgi:uncharacterized C2H2 Zn-finger protein